MADSARLTRPPAAWWRWTAGFLATALIALLAFAVGAASRPAVSEGRVKELVRQNDTWAKDRGRITQLLAEIAANQADVEHSVGQLQIKVDGLRIQVARLEERLQRTK